MLQSNIHGKWNRSSKNNQCLGFVMMIKITHFFFVTQSINSLNMKKKIRCHLSINLFCFIFFGRLLFAFNLCKLWMYTCCKSCNKDHPSKDVIAVFSNWFWLTLNNIQMSMWQKQHFPYVCFGDSEHKRKRPWILYFGL